MNKEEKDFIVKRGILGVGLPVAILMSVTTGFQVPGYFFRLQGFNLRTCLSSLIIFVPIFLVAGYFWGKIVYKFMRKKH